MTAPHSQVMIKVEKQQVPQGLEKALEQRTLTYNFGAWSLGLFPFSPSAAEAHQAPDPWLREEIKGAAQQLL